MKVITLEPLKKPQKVKPPVLRAAAYCRISHADERSSFDNQVEYYTRFICSHPDLQLVGIYADPEISGTQADNRPEFLRMIRDCEAGKIDIVYVKSISRFARNTLTTLTYVRHLKNLGVDIVFELDSIDTRNTYSEMILTVHSSMAQEESRSISENTKWGIRKRFEEGCARWRPLYGYTRTEEEGEYIPVPKEAEVVRMIYRACEHGRSVTEIARILKQKGINSPSGKSEWTRSQIGTILRNVKYAGDLMMQMFFTKDHLEHKVVRNDGSDVNSYYVKNHHEAIVDRKTFDRVQTVLSMKQCKSPVLYPFGQILICPHCGRTLAQKFIPVQDRRKGAGWYCDCGGFTIRSSLVECAVRRAYGSVPASAVQRKVETAKNKSRKRAAELMLKYKSNKPTLDTVEYYWVDDLIDHITFGAHTLTNEIVTEKTQAGEEYTEDRTLTVYWKFGMKTTVKSGVEKDSDNPNYLAYLMVEYHKRHAR